MLVEQACIRRSSLWLARPPYENVSDCSVPRSNKAYANNATLVSRAVRFLSLALKICQPRRAILDATALEPESAPVLRKADGIGTYQHPTAKMTERPTFRLTGSFKPQTALSGMITITTSEKTLIVEAVTSRAYVSMHVVPGTSTLPTHWRITVSTNDTQ